MAWVTAVDDALIDDDNERSGEVWRWTWAETRRSFRVDMEFLRRHPVRWLKHFWLHWIFVVAFVLKSWATRAEFFEVTALSSSWPYVLLVVAGVAAMSTFAPLDVRVQAVSGAFIAAVALGRSLMYVELLMEDIPPGVRALAAYLLAHWMTMFMLGVAWPRLSFMAGANSTIEAGAVVVGEAGDEAGGRDEPQWRDNDDDDGVPRGVA
jgi:hypothetical protein